MPTDKDNREERDTRTQQIIDSSSALRDRAADARREAETALKVSKALAETFDRPKHH